MNSRVKILAVFGTRPEAIKLISGDFSVRQAVGFEVRVCVTGQHRQMLDQVMHIFQIVPNQDLTVMTTNQGLAQTTAKILESLDDVMTTERPDIVLVQGDTNTCFAAALSAFYARIPVAHVEAGLRTGDLAAPFPEEANRALTTRIASWHFAPTEWARENLLRENVLTERIWVTGNTVVDALLWVSTRIRQHPTTRWQTALGAAWEVVQSSRPLMLITGHRRENFGQGVLSICDALRQLAEELPDWIFVYPVHFNPNVYQPVYERLQGISNVYLLDPLDYESFIFLMNRSCLILTDSGGIQEEAPSLGKPVLVMRDVTERPEGIRAGCVRLVGTTTSSIVTGVRRVVSDEDLYLRMSTVQNPFGDGRAAERIVEILGQI